MVVGILKYILLIAIFLLALFAGFYFAQESGVFKFNQSQPDAVNQVRYLVIRVDDLGKSNPSLQTIWGIFVSLSNPVTIYFSPIYPTQNNMADLAALFSLSKDRSLAQGFQKAIEKFNMDLTGYIIVDAQGSDGYLNWLIPAKNRITSTAPDSTKQVQALLSQQRQYYAQICQLLSKSIKANPQVLNWKGIYPDHMIPSPNIESIMVLIDRIFTDQLSIECHVLD